MTTHIKFLTKFVGKAGAVYALDADLNWVRYNPSDTIGWFSVFSSREVCISGVSIEEIANEAQTLRDKCPLGIADSWTAYRFLEAKLPGEDSYSGAGNWHDKITASFIMYIIPREVKDDRVLKPLSEHILFDLRAAGYE